MKKTNDSCIKGIGQPTEHALHDRVLSILDSKDKIPHVRKIGKFYYNFWQDANNKRGLWRRTTMESFSSPDTQWETVLDVDALCEQESESWVWKGHKLYTPKSDLVDPQLTLLSLSRGNILCSDAIVFYANLILM